LASAVASPSVGSWGWFAVLAEPVVSLTFPRAGIETTQLNRAPDRRQASRPRLADRCRAARAEPERYRPRPGRSRSSWAGGGPPTSPLRVTGRGPWRPEAGGAWRGWGAELPTFPGRDRGERSAPGRATGARRWRRGGRSPGARGGRGGRRLHRPSGPGGWGPPTLIGTGRWAPAMPAERPPRAVALGLGDEARGGRGVGGRSRPPTS